MLSKTAIVPVSTAMVIFLILLPGVLNTKQLKIGKSSVFPATFYTRREKNL